jgi:transposase
LGLQASPATLLRIISLAPERKHATPRVLGVDDFSFRRGCIFGTILIDLEKRVPMISYLTVKPSHWKNG